VPLPPGAWISSGRLKRLPGELTRISRHPSVHQPSLVEAEATSLETDLSSWEPEFQQILRVSRRHTSMDFTAYKPTTLERRIGRRMVLAQCENLAQYLTYLSDHPSEGKSLYQDLLIGVTSFFRDPSTFQTLFREIWSYLLATKAAGAPLRVWVPSCSTGEEVYSLAICLLEFLAQEEQPTPPIQLFGTDLNPQAIASARAGLYPPGAAGTLSPARLDHFFLRVNGSYQIRKVVRDLCVFAQHNLLKDPPSSRLDLLSCQNVLIYLESLAQPDLPLCTRSPRCAPARTLGNHWDQHRSLCTCQRTQMAVLYEKSRKLVAPHCRGHPQIHQRNNTRPRRGGKEQDA
jgi:two-component system CheB/CheR fusion protein